MSMPERFLPFFNYYLDESDPDIMILRCQDDSFVAAFSPDGATLGHASITITLNTYSHVSPDMQDTAADAMEAALATVS